MSVETESNISIINPANLETLKELRCDTLEEINGKFLRAKDAQRKWQKVDFKKRKAVILKFRNLLEKNCERLSQVLTSEMGKPISQSRNEIKGTLGRIDFFLRNTEKELKKVQVSAGEFIGFEPLGVVCNISAWNYPYFVGTNVFIPALLTGNAVLYKPSEITAITGLEIETLFSKAGLPKGLFATVIGTGSAGRALLDLPIDGVFFTGSYLTGVKIAQTAATKLIRVQLELGGKDPTYVCDDVNVKKAAESLADGAFYNTGQSCCSVERIYVHKKVYQKFTDHFVETVKQFKVGDPTEKETYIGALARGAQIAFLEDQVQDAVSKGAKLLTGGKAIDRGGYFFEPTVLTDVNSEMKVMREESFGPIIGIQKVASDAEAMKLMQETQYGLTAGVYTKSKTRAEKILSELPVGSAYWNCCDRVSPTLPWSGRKNSGLGVTLSYLGIQAFLHPKGWHFKKI